MKDLLANVVPLSKEMNQTLSNGVYAGKRSAYEADSGFKAAREFAKEYVDWTPTELGLLRWRCHSGKDTGKAEALTKRLLYNGGRAPSVHRGHGFKQPGGRCGFRAC